jgi:DNA ligase-1
MLAKFSPNAFTCEYKYDGQRAQVHLQENGKQPRAFHLPSHPRAPECLTLHRLHAPTADVSSYLASWFFCPGAVKIYSRHSEDMTDKYPDVAHLMTQLQEKSQGQLKDLVIDCELVAVDRAQNNRLLAFQTLSTRGRWVGPSGGGSYEEMLIRLYRLPLGVPLY